MEPVTVATAAPGAPVAGELGSVTDLARQPVPATATVALLGPPRLGARPAAASPASIQLMRRTIDRPHGRPRPHPLTTRPYSALRRNRLVPVAGGGDRRDRPRG